MSSSASNPVIILAALSLLLAGCGESKQGVAAEEAADQAFLGVLELPVSLRVGDAAPSNAQKVEISLAKLRIGGKDVVSLSAEGRLPESERPGGASPKISSAFKGASAPTIALELHAMLPYETVAATLKAAQSAGVRNVAFRVRKPGGSPDTGWLVVNGFKLTQSVDEPVAFETVASRSWDDFVNVWDAAFSACSGATSGNCLEKPVKVAEGGDLHMVLFASGDGVNMRFSRHGGPSLEELTKITDERRRKDEIFVLRDMPPDVVEGYMKLPFATEAGFQFRGREALGSPSPVTKTMAPVCGTSACGVVLEADALTRTIKFVSLIGAAFPDGTPSPSLAFVMPST